MNSNQFKVFLATFLFSVIAVISAGKFDAKKDVFYEIYCRFSNQSIDSTKIDLSILQNDNFIWTGKDTDKNVTGVKNCRWIWNPNRPTRIFIHGYFSDEATLRNYAEAYLERDDFNFIAINWLRGAKTINYVKARHRILEVGRTVANFIDYLVTLGLNLDDLICVVHSLGAHTCGIVGKNIQSGKLAIIIALDPALPLFHLKHKNCRLHYTDARYVQVIHTSGGFLGIRHPIGHADFYPNFGSVQPSCRSFIPFTTQVCSHTRVHDLFIESLKLTSQFWSSKCASYGEIYDKKCSEHGHRVLMGGDKISQNIIFEIIHSRFFI